jgi:hypothetical protein
MIRKSGLDKFYDDDEARKPSDVKFKLHHRGRGKISFPFDAGKALILITDQGTWKKAIKAFRYAEMWRLFKLRGGSPDSHEKRAERHIEDFFESGVVTKEQFRKAGEIFFQTHRPGVDLAKHKERILKLFSELGISTDQAKPGS